MDIMALKQLEQTGAFAQIEGYLTGEALSARDAAAFKYASAYYIRRGKPSKSLECYSHYLTFAENAEPDAEAIALAIDCARRLDKHMLVREYLFSLSPKEREKLPTATLLSAAHSLIQLNQLDEAEKILGFIRHRSGVPQLMSFDALIEQKFGNLANARAYIAKNAPLQPAADPGQTVQQALTIALAHMANRNYLAAEKILENCKSGIAA
jgi:hypothetical protein